ncbi:hypothetical protein J6590_044774 [Homalodisca vitripennis]|nr:hypothetical protein J6590_044774 [Homalodisca vitripennis]
MGKSTCLFGGIDFGFWAWSWSYGHVEQSCRYLNIDGKFRRVFDVHAARSRPLQGSVLWPRAVKAACSGRRAARRVGVK